MEKFGETKNELLELLESISDEEWENREKVVEIYKARERSDRLKRQIEIFSKCGFSEIKRLETLNAEPFFHRVTRNIVIDYKKKEESFDEEFVYNPHLSYIFRGDIGRGKTLLAHKIAWEYAKDDKSVLFIDCNNVSVIAAKIKKGDMSFFDVINKKLVVIDDLTNPKKEFTDVGIDFLNDTISQISEKNANMIITCNGSIKHLLKDTTIDRMYRNWSTIYFVGESLRKKIDI